MRFPLHVNPGPKWSELPIHKGLADLSARMSVLPLPAENADLDGIIPPIDDVSGAEPPFDPSTHLSLETPAFVKKVDAFLAESPLTVPRVENSSGSVLAYTAPFRLLSDEGVRVMRDILRRLTPSRSYRSVQYRGLFYRSAFVRNLVTSPVLLSFLEKFTGEPVVPHLLLMDSGFVNVGKPADETAVVKGTVDPWHFDSCTYVAVTILSDIDGMEGGELQVMKHRRDAAMNRITETMNEVPEEELETISYESAGKCVLAQGSEAVHRVTSVISAKEPRLSFGIGLQPANPFRADKTSLTTFAGYDGWPTACLEFYRMKAHALGAALSALAVLPPPSAFTEAARFASQREKLDTGGKALGEAPAVRPRSCGGMHLAAPLRAICSELERVASLLDGSQSDRVGYVDEAAYSVLRGERDKVKDGA
uniref:Fe2OG dioxygenase domain-containing protein n=1 Tax=Chromera velia CCMP2878 TaxID=1169474 RepID=A0A0G4GFW5_9ALVE|eukprot:Cvel_21634.t1-p1 / transcript=Cvel_21634.t1 / gene=Cvel_21634 / organism=Chromera_velia_CCMP2878 / gene_product=hypothetical protein / transcript_product=hypothetical protein / location=Cvel_scaffold2045:18813-20449(+) / protein_length=421 / sequence_SO=supercontig / SO=protein_coding / is_pseudo=false